MKRNLLAIRIVMTLSWRVDKRRLVIGSALLLAGSLTQPGIAILVRNITDGVVSRDPAWIIVSLAIGIAVCMAGQLLLGHFGHLWYYELGELDEVELSQYVSRAIHSDQPLDQVESPEIADTIDLLRQDIVRIRMTLESTILLCAVALQLTVTCVLLATVSPFLLFLPLGASVPVMLTARADRPVQNARETSAGLSRLIKHLRDASTRADQVKEVRLGGGANRVRALHDEAQLSLARQLARGYRRYSIIRLLGQLPFAISLLAAITYTAILTVHGQSSPGELIMVMTLATQIGGQVSSALLQLNNVSGAASGLARMDELAHGSSRSDASDAPTGEPADSLRHGIAFQSVSYTYPGSAEPGLQNITLEIAAGTAVAIVGENGAGKSTLIKLVQGLYLPDSGVITVDGAPLTSFVSEAWHHATSSLFQDFVHFEFRARESIGIGDIDHVDDTDAVVAAIDRAEAHSLIDRIGVLDTFVGRAYRNGEELSGGQWQTLGLARALMKGRPLLLTLDEPGHSLDPESELRMIDAYETAARSYASRSGAIVFYVTHRLSSVRSADLVIVLRGGMVDAIGTHDDLIRQAGYYSDLFAMQAAAYSSD